MKHATLRKLFESLAALPPMGEPIDQLSHALQSAGNAIAAGADDELILASALHDIGRSPLVVAGHPLPHEDAAAEFLRRFMPARVVWLVRAHVDAKRYLAFAENWDKALSEGSKRSLIKQGGAMTEDEAARFLEHPWAQDAIALRRWDDAAKVPGAPAPTIGEVMKRYAP
jgi:predicted HD phosphohydrolase